MQKLNREEVDRLYFGHEGLIRELKTLEIGEGLVIKHEEWTKKTSVDRYVAQSFRKSRSEMKFKTRRLNDKSGYVVIRIR
jgi:hypothetical protein